MRKEETYDQTVTWSDLVGRPAYRDDLDWDDVYDRNGHDYRRAQRDGWGSQLVWDGH